MKFFEQLSGGLSTRKHPDLIEEGKLAGAVDGAYEPDDGGLWVAPGRAKCGASTIQSSPTIHLAAVSWDPGTTVDGSAEELKQLIFVPESNPTGTLSSVPLKANPADLSYETFRTYPLPAGSPPPAWGTDGIEVVAFDNDYFILPGTTENYWLSRRSQSGGPVQQYLARHGLPSQALNISTDFTAGVPTIAPRGYYIWWFTWYDSVRDVESGRGPVQFWDPNIAANRTWPPSVLLGNFLLVNADIINVKLTTPKDPFDTARPASADKIRVYRSKMFDNDQISSGIPLGNQWPVGSLVAEVLVSSMTTVSGAAGVFYVLFNDVFGLTNEGLQRRGTVTNPNLGTAFPIATLFGVPVDQAGAPPAASTGCRFEDSLCLNDMNDPRKVHYSYPGEPHRFPSHFIINMDTSDTDEVVSLRTLGNRMFVGMKEGVWKVNWLLFEGDIQGAQGRVKEVVSERHGVVNRKAVAKLDLEQMGPMIAWVSQTGIYATDLDNVIQLTKDLDWEALVPDPSNAILVNNVRKKRLEMAFGPERESLLYVSYSDGIRITGPVNRPGKILAMVEGVDDSGQALTISADENGFLFHEGKGTTDASDGTAMQLRATTRTIYPDAFGDEIRFQRLCFHADGTGQVDVTARVKGKRGLSKTEHTAQASLTLPDEPLVTAPCAKHGEKISFEVVATGSVRVNFVGGIHDGLGEVERA